MNEVMKGLIKFTSDSILNVSMRKLVRRFNKKNRDERIFELPKFKERCKDQSSSILVDEIFFLREIEQVKFQKLLKNFFFKLLNVTKRQIDQLSQILKITIPSAKIQLFFVSGQLVILSHD